MHTSTRLRAEDFSFWQQAAGQSTKDQSKEVDFATFAPDYHEQDRIGVVSVGIETGVLQTSYALLALTTVFYDCLRARQENFFNYPQHFAFVGAAQDDAIHAGKLLLPATTPQLWNAWSWLDVWPDAKWVTATPSAGEMMRRAFDYQINRLFWPRSLRPDASVKVLPSYVWRMLKTHLKAVYLYGDADGERDVAWSTGESVEIRVQRAAQEIVQESVVQLPAPLLLPGALDISHAASAPQRYTRLDVDAFVGLFQDQVEIQDSAMMAAAG